jgi:hypothetical protein
MTTKLTLSVDSKTIQKAKKYAKKKGTSVSRLFEDHIASITDNDKNIKEDPFDALRKLKGIAKNLSKGTDYDDLITSAIIEKHLK